MLSTFSADPEKRAPLRRPRRKQVARACDWCRLNRTKCDDSQPCENCRSRGNECSNSKRTEVLTLPAASREIQRLRNTISELQARISQDQATRKYATPPESDHVGISPQESHVPRPMNSHSRSPTTEWKGIQIHDVHGGAIYYGPLSSSYFGARMGHFLAEALSKYPDSQFQTDTLRLTYPPTFLTCQKTGPDFLSRAEEQFFLDLLWQSFHCVYPIIVEGDFRTYYDSLWKPEDQSARRPSALVDSLLSVCMQYGSTFLISDDNDARGSHHASSVSKGSHGFFRQAQTLLLDEVERPSIMTLQSQLYCVIYLHNTCLLNAAYSLLGTAVRVAKSLRLHLPPPDTSIQEEQELYRRLWHTLIVLDCQLSMSLGRPPMARVDEVNFDLPGDTQEHALLSGSMLMVPSNEEISWLTFHVQSIRLLKIVQGVQSSFYQEGARLLEQKGAQSIYEDPFLVEELAAYLARGVGVVYDWARNVPPSLQNARDSGEPFSSKRTPIRFDAFSPIWLQRQRIILELLYHHLQLSNFRSFLRFPPGQSSITPLSDCHSINALNHAMALTNILHQVLTETDLLRGWHPVFQYQWEAALCILGFVLANPVCPPTPAARKSIQTAIQCLEIIGKNSTAAASAANIIRQVGIQAEMLVGKFHSSLSTRNPPSKERIWTSAKVQMVSAPGLTPEYLSMGACQPVKIGDFMINNISTEDGLLPFDTALSPGDMGDADAILSTMGLPWTNSEMALGQFSIFPEGSECL
ncbi:C6 transcription factor [Penicillium verhagenii]|nr:C6 transcription factor [Penicillium verhagenii]